MVIDSGTYPPEHLQEMARSAAAAGGRLTVKRAYRMPTEDLQALVQAGQGQVTLDFTS